MNITKSSQMYQLNSLGQTFFFGQIDPYMVMFDLVNHILLYLPIFYYPMHYSRFIYVTVVNILQSNDEPFRSWVLVYLDRDSHCPYLLPGETTFRLTPCYKSTYLLSGETTFNNQTGPILAHNYPLIYINLHVKYGSNLIKAFLIQNMKKKF